MLSLKRITSLLLASTIIVSTTPKANANPAVLAPAAFCAGTAGVGCILIGTAVIGGALYYVWRLQDGRRITTDSYGQVMRYLDDPESDDVGTWEDPLDTRNAQKAEQICRVRARNLGASFKLIRDPGTRKMICVFSGGNGR